MFRFRCARVALAFPLLLVAAASARADPIQWNYNWEPTTAVVKADKPGTGTIQLFDEKAGSAAGNSDTVATNLTTLGTADSKKPDTFTNAAYGLVLTLTDEASGKSGTLTFKGLLNGTVSAKSAHIGNTFIVPTTQTLLLGQDLYTVTITSYAPPGPPTASKQGAISASVSVQPNTVVGDTPEPATLTLAGLGACGAGLGCWWRRRDRKALALRA
jgi:hypothetical protein